MSSMKVALITGGSRGIGAATVEIFAKNGYSVILNYNRSISQAQQLQQRLIAEGCDVHLFKADVSNVSEIADMFGYVAKYFKKLDVLVNNAGVALTKQIQDVTEAEFDGVFNVNVRGTYFCCKHALPLLVKSGGASIVNVSSVWGLYGASCESVYSASKHAVLGVTRSLSAELAQTGISVCAVCPPIVLTDMSSAYTKAEIDEFCRETSTRAYSPEEAAETIFQAAVGRSDGIIEL